MERIVLTAYISLACLHQVLKEKKKLPRVLHNQNIAKNNKW